jgi:predicted DNA-binding transcriptional regulator AlpA
MDNKKRFLSVKETAEYLNISPRTIYNKTGRKAKVKFPVRPKRVGRCVRFDIKDLNEYVASL